MSFGGGTGNSRPEEFETGVSDSQLFWVVGERRAGGYWMAVRADKDQDGGSLIFIQDLMYLNYKIRKG